MSTTTSFDYSQGPAEGEGGPVSSDDIQEVFEDFSVYSHRWTPAGFSFVRDLRSHLAPSLHLSWKHASEVDSTSGLGVDLEWGAATKPDSRTVQSLLSWVKTLLEGIERASYETPSEDLAPDPQPVPDWWLERLSLYRAREDSEFESPWS